MKIQKQGKNKGIERISSTDPRSSKIPHNSLYSNSNKTFENLNLSSEKLEFLKKVNEFNIEARYPDKKFSFYKLCTKEFTEKYFTEIKEIYKWLLEKMK